MKFCAHKKIGWVALLIVGGVILVHAEEPARSRGTAINFSAPKSDSVSTNLNDLRKPGSPFQDLEATLKSPFEALEKPPAGPNYRESRRMIQQQQMLNRQPLKDQLNKRAEQMFLNPELFEGDQGDDAFFQLSKDSLDPYQKKPKNSSERYNVHQERDRMVITNRPAAQNLFGEKNPARPEDGLSDSKTVKPFKTGGYADDERTDLLGAAARPGTNNSSLNNQRGILARRPDGFNSPAEDLAGRRRSEADARMEDFKRLLEGSRYTPPGTVTRSRESPGAASFSANTSGYNAPGRPAAALSSGSEWSSFKSTTKEDSRDEFATSAGLVGKLEKPRGLPEFPVATRTLAPTTTAAEPDLAPVKKITRSTFKVPQRRF